MNEITFSTYGNKQYMKGKKMARASFGTFYVVGNKVEWTAFDMTEQEADNAFTDDLSELKKGNVNYDVY